MAVEEDENLESSKPQGKLSHKQFKRLIQKERRRIKRQEEAKRREKAELEEKKRIENDPFLRAQLEAEEKDREDRRLADEKERQRQHELWLAREVAAQEEFKKKKEEEERRLKEKMELEQRIKEEWESEQRKEKDAEERRQKEIKDKEDALFREIEKPAVSSQKNEEAWHNPIAPTSNSSVYGTEQDTVNCAFYLKTGACRFGERCSRHHPKLSSSVTLLIPSMYQDIGLSQTMLDEADHDASLEYDEQEAHERYVVFYEDVLPEFQSIGTVVQFKVCCNNEPHLRGNVYVQYESEDDCLKAFSKFNGRWFAGKQLSCEFSPVTRWKSAICGLFDRKRCTRGKNCNFLHVYRNPGNAFWRMDRDLDPRDPPDSVRSHRSSRGSENRHGRHWERDDRDFEREWERSDRSYRSYRKSDRERDRKCERERDDDYDRRSRRRSRRPNEEDGDYRRNHSRSTHRDLDNTETEEYKDRFGRDRRRNIDYRKVKGQSRERNKEQRKEKDSGDSDNSRLEKDGCRIAENDKLDERVGDNGNAVGDRSHVTVSMGERIKAYGERKTCRDDHYKTRGSSAARKWSSTEGSSEDSSDSGTNKRLISRDDNIDNSTDNDAFDFTAHKRKKTKSKSSRNSSRNKHRHKSKKKRHKHNKKKLKRKHSDLSEDSDSEQEVSVINNEDVNELQNSLTIVKNPLMPGSHL